MDLTEDLGTRRFVNQRELAAALSGETLDDLQTMVKQQRARIAALSESLVLGLEERDSLEFEHETKSILISALLRVVHVYPKHVSARYLHSRHASAVAAIRSLHAPAIPLKGALPDNVNITIVIPFVLSCLWASGPHGCRSLVSLLQAIAAGDAEVFELLEVYLRRCT
jgi:hypothetical protein